VAVSVADEFPDEVPVGGETVSHDAVVLALQSNMPFPAFEILTVWTGFASPCVTEKAKLAGLKLIVGCNPYAFPFPGFAMASPFSELPPAPLHAVSRRKHRATTRRPIDRENVSEERMVSLVIA
jgi:hypothetical protein